MQPYIVCETQEKADVIRNQLVEFMEALAMKLVPVPRIEADCTDEEQSAYEEADNANREVIKAVVWPYGIDMSSDVPQRYGDSEDYLTKYDQSSIAIWELPLM